MQTNATVRGGARLARVAWAAGTLLITATLARSQGTEIGIPITKPVQTFNSTQFFGKSVDAEGEFIVVGSEEAGQAEIEVLRWVGSNLTHWQTIDATVVGSPVNSSFGGTTRSIRLRGDTLVIGGSGLGVVGSQSTGAVVVFELDAQQLWQPSQTLVPVSTPLIEDFGFCVDFSDHWLVVGSYQTDYPGTNGGNSEGAVFVYEKQGSQWQPASPDTLAHPDLLGPAGSVGRQFGYSVALHGDRLVVGAPNDRIPNVVPVPVVGSIVEFDLGATDPQGSGVVTLSPAPLHLAAFGLSVSLSDTTLLVGEPNRAPNGRAYRADVSQGPIGPLQALLSPAPAGSAFGWSTATEGSRMLIGGPGQVRTAWEIVDTSAGLVTTELLRSFTPGGQDSYGLSAALSARGLFVGAPDSVPPPPIIGAGGAGILWYFGREGLFQRYCTAGASASGCEASISASGTPSASAATGFFLQSTNVEGEKDGVFFFGANGRQANPWGNGTSFQCVIPPVKRGGVQNGTGTAGACDGQFFQDLNARWTQKPNHNPGPGAFVQAQLWYRDPSSTSNQTTGLSDAIEFLVGP